MFNDSDNDKYGEASHSNESGEKDYEVGYCKPPKAHQFPKGVSGNPKGKPKLIKAFKIDLREELEEIITVQEGGKAKLVTKQRILIKKLLNKAVGGELGALKTLTSLIALHLGDTGAEFEELSEEDKKLFDKYIYKSEKEKNNG